MTTGRRTTAPSAPGSTSCASCAPDPRGGSTSPLTAVQRLRYDTEPVRRRPSASMSKSGFGPSIHSQSEDFPGWYNDVVLKAELADYSPARLHDHPAVWVCHLGVDARRARPAHQAHGPQQRLLSAVRAQVPA